MKARAHGCSLKLAAEGLCTFQADSVTSSFRSARHLQQLGLSAEEPLFSTKTKTPPACSSLPYDDQDTKGLKTLVPGGVCSLMLQEFYFYASLLFSNTGLIAMGMAQRPKLSSGEL